MFAEIVKFLESPEVIVPTMVRLECVNNTYRIRRDTIYHSAKFGFVLGSRFVNGELSALVGTPTAGQDKLPSEMVQAGAQLMNRFSGNQPNFLKWYAET